jgi:hypothetical protein
VTELGQSVRQGLRLKAQFSIGFFDKIESWVLAERRPPDTPPVRPNIVPERFIPGSHAPLINQVLAGACRST